MTAELESYKLLKSALEDLNLPRALDALMQLDTLNVMDALVSRFAQPGTFLIHKDRSKRDQFFNALQVAPVMASNHPEALTYLFGVRAKISYIEQAFDQIAASLPACDISKFPGDVQFWSHVERASQELKFFHDMALETMHEAARDSTSFMMPEMAIVHDQDGREVNVDAAFSNIISSLSLTLKLLSHTQKLLVEGKMIAPVQALISDEHVYKAGSIQQYAMAWNALEDVANRTFFFGGDIVDFETAGIPQASFPEEFFAKFTDRRVFHRTPADAEGYDFIANRRLHSWLQHNYMQLMFTTNLDSAIVAPGDSIPGMDVGQFVSREEAITLVTLCETLSFDAFADQTRYHGLTLREWVRGYSALKLLVKAKPSHSSLISFEKGELEAGLKTFHFPETSISMLMYHLTFGADCRDLFDSPLICSNDGKYSVLAQSVLSSNLPIVLFSKLSSLETQFEKKGEGFERKVVEFLREKGWRCEPTSFTFENAQYEYDALLLMDDTLFLIECKNKSLSGNNAVQALHFDKFIGDAIKQAKRLEKGLRARPEIVEALFDRKLSDLTVVPIILNSLTYSRETADGIYFCDYSALSKFFNENAINEFYYDGGVKKVRGVLQVLWTGDKPTATELEEYLRLPPQVMLMADHLTYTKYPRATSEHSMFCSGVLDINEPAMAQAKKDTTKPL